MCSISYKKRIHQVPKKTQHDTLSPRKPRSKQNKGASKNRKSTKLANHPACHNACNEALTEVCKFLDVPLTRRMTKPSSMPLFLTKRMSSWIRVLLPRPSLMRVPKLLNFQRAKQTFQSRARACCKRVHGNFDSHGPTNSKIGLLACFKHGETSLLQSIFPFENVFFCSELLRVVSIGLKGPECWYPCSFFQSLSLLLLLLKYFA